MHRQLLNKCFPTWLTMSSYRIPLSFGVAVLNQLQYVSWPHEYLHRLYTHCRANFDSLVRGAVGQLASFWRSVEHNPTMHEHPLKKRRNWMSRTVPLSFHGDGVPCVGVGKGWVNMVCCFSFASMIVASSTEDRNHLIWFL